MISPLEILALRYIAKEWDDKDKEYFNNLTNDERLIFIYHAGMHRMKRE